MLTRQGIGGENESIDHKEPRKEQVPLPPHREPLGTGNSRPGWKGPSHAIGITQHAGRIELMPQDCRNASHLATLCFDGTDRQ